MFENNAIQQLDAPTTDGLNKERRIDISSIVSLQGSKVAKVDEEQDVTNDCTNPLSFVDTDKSTQLEEVETLDNPDIVMIQAIGRDIDRNDETGSSSDDSEPAEQEEDMFDNNNPHFVFSNSNRYQKNIHMVDAKAAQLYNKVRNNVKCFVSSCRKGKRVNSTVYNVVEHYDMHVQNRDCTRIEADQFLQRQHDDMGYDIEFWNEYYTVLQSTSSASYDDSFVNAMNNFARFLFFAENCLSAINSNISFRGKIDVRSILEHPSVVLEYCEAVIKHFRLKNLRKSLLAFGTMVARRIDRFLPSASAVERGAILEQFKSTMSAALQLKNRSRQQSDVIKRNRLAQSTDKASLIDHILFQTESNTVSEVFEDCFKKVFEEADPFDIPSYKNICNFSLIRGRLLAIISLLHGKRVSVFQNLRVWEFVQAEKRVTESGETSYLIRVSQHKTGDKNADQLHLRESEYILFKRFYDATEGHPFFNRQRQQFTAAELKLAEEVYKDSTNAGKPENEVMNEMRHFFFNTKDGSSLTKPSQTLNEWQRRMQTHTGCEFKKVTADDAREAWTVSAKNMRITYKDQLSTRADVLSNDEVESAVANYQSHDQKTADNWYSSSGFRTAADQQLKVMNLLRGLHKEKTYSRKKRQHDEEWVASKSKKIKKHQVSPADVENNTKDETTIVSVAASDVGREEASQPSNINDETTTTPAESREVVTEAALEENSSEAQSHRTKIVQDTIGNTEPLEQDEAQETPGKDHEESSVVTTEATAGNISTSHASIVQKDAQLSDIQLKTTSVATVTTPPTEDELAAVKESTVNPGKSTKKKKRNKKRHSKVECGKEDLEVQGPVDEQPDSPEKMKKKKKNKKKTKKQKGQKQNNANVQSGSIASEARGKLQKSHEPTAPQPIRFRPINSPSDMMLPRLMIPSPEQTSYVGFRPISPVRKVQPSDTEDESDDEEQVSVKTKSLQLIQKKISAKNTPIKTRSKTKPERDSSPFIKYPLDEKDRPRYQEHCKRQDWPGIEVRECAEGKGLFAATEIPKGTLVCDYGGDKFPEEEWRNMPGTPTYSCKYKDAKGKSWIVDAAATKHVMGRYSNYSEWHWNMMLKSGLLLVTGKNIRKDEQLTWNYGGIKPTDIETNCVEGCIGCANKKRRS